MPAATAWRPWVHGESLGLGDDARRHRRPPRLHASVRLRARRGARARRASTCGCSRRASASAPCRAAAGFTVDDSLYRPRRPGSASRSRPARGEGARASLGARPARRSPTATCSTCSGSRRRRPTPGSCTRAGRSSSPPTTSLPRRTARRTRTWRRLFGRFDRIVTHSERGRRTLEAFGVPAAKLRVIPHPAFRSDPVRRRRRPHRARARRDPALQGPSGRRRGRPRGSRRATPRRRRPADPARRPPPRGGRPRRVAARLPGRARDRRSRSATRRSPSSPTGPSSTSPARCCRRSEPGVPAVVYDVGGLGEIVGAFGAGRVVAARGRRRA